MSQATSTNNPKPPKNPRNHGLMTPIDPEQERDRLAETIELWTVEAETRSEAEDALIRDAAEAAVQRDRIIAIENAALSVNAHDALKKHDRIQKQRARRVAMKLGTQPKETVEALESNAYGCDWMVRKWRELAAILDAGYFWNAEQLSRALRLLGHPAVPPTLPGKATDLYVLAVAANSPPLGPSLNPEPHRMVNAASAFTDLKNFVQAEIDRLEARGQELYGTIDAERRKTIALRAMVPTDKDAQTLKRYTKEAKACFDKSLRLLIQLRNRHRDEEKQQQRSAQELAKPMTHVGGGWWREEDATVAPPGCIRQPHPSGAWYKPVPTRSSSMEDEGRSPEREQEPRSEGEEESRMQVDEPKSEREQEPGSEGVAALSTESEAPSPEIESPSMATSMDAHSPESEAPSPEIESPSMATSPNSHSEERSASAYDDRDHHKSNGNGENGSMASPEAEAFAERSSRVHPAHNAAHNERPADDSETPQLSPEPGEHRAESGEERRMEPGARKTEAENLKPEPGARKTEAEAPKTPHPTPRADFEAPSAKRSPSNRNRKSSKSGKRRRHRR